MGKEPEEGKVVERHLSVSTSRVYQRPTEEEERDKYREDFRIQNAIRMPTICCDSCGHIYKPWSLDLEPKDWKSWDKVPCPKCGTKNLVFSDMDMKKRYYENKLMEGPLSKRIEQIERLVGLPKDRKDEKTLLERLGTLEDAIIKLIQGVPQKPAPRAD